MKKLLTFLFALTISVYSFGIGNQFVWNGSVSNDWQVTGNWTITNTGGTATWPGEFSATEKNDYVIFNDGGLWKPGFSGAITNVPSCTLGRLEILPVGNSGTEVYLEGVADGVTITFDGSIIYANLWIVKIDDYCVLECNAPYKRVKVVCEPGVNFWQKNYAYFYPAEYTVCPVDKGFLLQSVNDNHAEYIQQEFTVQSVKGWQEIWVSPWSVTNNNPRYHYISPPITSSWDPTIPGPPAGSEFVNKPCRVPNCLCVFDGDYVRKFINGTGWDNWMASENCFGVNVNIETGRGYEVALGPNEAPIHELYGYFNSGQNGTPSGIKLPVTTLGWNLIGNPYASAITFAESGGSPTAGEGWTWDRLYVAPIAYWWDNCVGGYRSYNWYTGLPQTTPPGVCPAGGDPKILPRAQGFFVNVIATTMSSNTDIWVSNLARRFRDTYEIGKSLGANQMQLVLNDADGKYQDNVYMGFRDDVTSSDFDNQLDAYKLYNDITNTSQLYIRTTDNKDASVKSVKAETGNIMVPISLKVSKTGSYSIDASSTISTFSQNTGILLKDTKTNTTVDLKVNPVYTFTATEGDDDVRFNLYFSNVLYGVNNLAANSFKVYSFEQSIFIQNNDPKAATGTVVVYDMIGKQMIQENLNSNAVTRINTNLNTGFYIVSIKTGNGVYNQKVYIK